MAQNPFRSFVIEKHISDFALSGSSKKYSQLPSYVHIAMMNWQPSDLRSNPHKEKRFFHIGNSQKGAAKN